MIQSVGFFRTSREFLGFGVDTLVLFFSVRRFDFNRSTKKKETSPSKAVCRNFRKITISRVVTICDSISKEKWRVVHGSSLSVTEISSKWKFGMVHVTSSFEYSLRARSVSTGKFMRAR